ncbi:MAG: insulinase family protein [Bacteroidetes bacterium]|nr:insulinase family protein [Bacteroidota bacterium]
MKAISLFITASLVVCSLLGPTATHAQQTYEQLTFEELGDFEIPSPEVVTLSSGIKVFLIEDNRLPIVNFQARVGTGSIYEPADKVGLAALTGQVMRSGGTSSVSADELNEQLESIGASLESSIGSSNGTVFASALSEHVGTVLPLMADLLMNPAFPEEKIALAKRQFRSGISRRNDDAQDIAFREFNSLIYGETSPYARYEEYATIDAITRGDVVDFHAAWFVPNNVSIGVWGDFESGAMIRHLERAFSSWAPRPNFQRPPQPQVKGTITPGVYAVDKPDVSQTTLLLGHPGEVTLDHPDYAAITMMNEVLSGGFSGRLFQEVRDNQGLAYSVFGGYTANYERTGLFYAGVMTKSSSTVQAAQSILNEVARMRAEPPTDEELTFAREAYLNSFVFNFDTRNEVVSRLMTYDYYGYPSDFLQQQKAQIEQVTPADVQRVAQTYLKPDLVKIIAVGNVGAFETPLSTLGPVTTLDITIPTGEERAQALPPDAASLGRQWFERAKAQLGGNAFDTLTRLQGALDATMITPDGMNAYIEATMDIRFGGEIMLTQKMPMGAITVRIVDGAVILEMPQGSMPAPKPVETQVMSQLWQNMAYLFNQDHQSPVDVSFVGEEVYLGKPVAVLSIQPPSPALAFELWVDTSTEFPVQLVTQSMGPDGAPVKLYNELSDYREVGPIKLPFSSEQTANGNPMGGSQMTSASVE